MTTELEQEFFNTFGIEPEFGYWCKKFDETNIADCNGIKELSNKCAKCENGYIKYKYYPVITAEKLLEMICIWNYIMPCIDDCIIPIDYLGLKSIVLDKMIRYSEIEYEFDVDALKYQIKQLFNET